MIGYQRSTVQSCLSRRQAGPLYGSQVSSVGGHQHQTAGPTPSPPGYHSSASSITSSSSPSSSSSSSSPSSRSPISPNLLDYYPGINNDGLRLTWFHEANNRSRLNAALMNNHLIVDGDVILAEMSRYPIPIMAKAPISVSDITLEDWLTEITRAESPKGVRLNFNSTRTVEPAFRVLARHADYLKGPLILNANILSGTSQSSLTVIQNSNETSNSTNNQNQNNNNGNGNQNNNNNNSNSPAQPVDAWTFLMLCRTRFPKSIISIGWLTPDYFTNGNTGQRNGDDLIVPLINSHHNHHRHHNLPIHHGQNSNSSSGLPSPSSPMPQQTMATNLSMNQRSPSASSSPSSSNRSSSPVTATTTTSSPTSNLSSSHHLPLNLNLNLNHLAHLNHQRHHQQLSQHQLNQLNHHLSQLNQQFTQHRINSLAHLQQHQLKDINGNAVAKNSIGSAADNLLIKMATQSSQLTQHQHHQLQYNNCYSREMIDQMASVVKEYNLTQPITFPVHATMLKNSLGELQRLLYQVGNNSTLTVMANENDLVTLDDLMIIRKSFASNQVMYDLPEVLANTLRHELGI